MAHSKVSRGRTEREGELLQRQIALDNHAKETGVALTGEKKKEFELLAAERTLRGNLWNEAENSVANRFTVNQGESLRQPYGLYLNRAETATEGDQCELQQDDQDPNQRFANTLRAIRMSFFCNNGYFPDTEEGWKSAGVQTAWLKAVDPATGEELSPEASLKLLKELCGGKAGIEHLQAGRLDRMRGAEWLEQVTQRYADQRNAIITVLWDQFAARDAKEILANKEAETDKKQNEAPEEDGKNAPPPSGGPQESPSSTPPEPSLGQPPEPSGAKPDEAEPQPESVREPEPVTVMLDDLLKVAEKDDHAAAVLKKMEEAAGKGDAGSMPVQPVPGKTMDIPEAKVGDWSDYESCCAQFGPDIRQVHQLLQKIQERRTRAMPIPSHQYSLMPEDGDMTRFDESRHKDLIKRIVTGRNVSEDDVRRFGDDHDQRRPAPIDWVMLTDGSGSMYQKKGLSGTRWPFAPVQAAMQIGCIVNEAARDTNVNVYNGLWGNATPLLLSQPGDSRHATGEAIAGIADSQNWGTQLAPSIHHMAGVLADRRQPSEIAGNTHFNIISDGDLMDSFAAQAMLEDLLTHSRHSTVDIVVIQDQESKMDRLAEQLRQKFGGRVGHVHCNAPQEAHEAIIGLMQQRLQSTRQGDGVQRDVKRREMARARDAMEQRGR